MVMTPYAVDLVVTGHEVLWLCFLVLAEQIRALSPPDGEIFLRHYLLLETAAEIAPRYGLTESAVRSRLHRIRKLLQEEVPR